ncbi:MAG: hypothetical protein EOM00_12525 [Clostridia bacterium]|nr:hypothetical protein [Clostridia bacterium]
MQNISIDIETFSKTDLTKSGVYRYAEDDSFEILLFGYSIDHGPVQVIDLAMGEKIPAEIKDALVDSKIVKWAFNAQFERTCLSKYVGQRLKPEGWHCTMIWAATLGLPLSLEGVGAVLGLEKQKLKEGKDLIRYFCVPCKATKTNDGRTRNYPINDMEKWELFKSYNARDVETELAIQDKLSKFPVSEYVWKQYHLDQEINDAGIALDMDLVKQAIDCDKAFKKKHMDRAILLTGLDNPNSPIQLKEWLEGKGQKVDSLAKAAVKEMLASADGEVEEVLQLRQLLAKSSVKKYAAMENAICKDGRARGLIQFYGANRTGRYSGRLIQVQNLPQNHISDLKVARELIKVGDFEGAELLYDSVPNVLSELIRTAFVPKKDCRFLVADFSAIEARVIAWMAGEKWRMDVFATHGKIYEASASAMFHIPIEEITKGSPLRQKGKIAELALGYGGSVGALTAMGALDMGVPEEELKPLVDAWRKANPMITKLWWDVDKAAITAIKEKRPVKLHSLIFEYASGILFIVMPSGRRLAYVKPRIFENDYGRENISYEGVGESKKWMRIPSYGPKFVENIVQGISRDILAETMNHLAEEGYYIVMHVHDECVIEAPLDANLDTICNLMGHTPIWAPGLLLRADGYECEYYKKE